MGTALITDRKDIKPERRFEGLPIIVAIRKTIKSMIWGSNSWTNEQDKYGNDTGHISFRVNGYILKGFVDIILAWDDTFTVYFSDKNGNVVGKSEGVYVEDLLDRIDCTVETVDNYASMRK